jgi:cysteinyl-tRNA synthetase
MKILSLCCSNYVLLQTEETVMPYLKILSEFRENVRNEARTLKAVPILKECDKLRDEVLPNVGVRLEDREGAINNLNSGFY